MTSLFESSFCNGAYPRRNSSREEYPTSTMNKLLRHQFSRKDKSNPRSSTTSSSPTSPVDNHPQSNRTQSTRRPANPPTVENPFKDVNEQPPPPYTPAPNASPMIPVIASSSAADTQNAQAPAADDRYAFLSTFDTIFLIDDSGSMAGGRWRETAEALKSITPICTAHDEDGIDLYFLNRADSDFHHGVKDAARVEQIFNSVKPGGGTPTGQRLNQILKPYIQRYERSKGDIKPINLICITDGEPSDDVESPLIWAAKKLDKLDAPAWQVGVQFFQVGRDEEARKHLASLDDELAEIAGTDDLRDIVDTVPFKGEEGTTLSGDGVLKVVLGSVNRRLDRKKVDHQ